MNLWEGYNAPPLEPPKPKKHGEWTCPQHGSRCSPGICKEYASVERDKRLRDAREKREEVGRQRDAQKARDKPKGGRKKAEAMGEGESEGRAHLPPLCSDASSGTSTASSGESDSDKSNKQGTAFIDPKQLARI